MANKERAPRRILHQVFVPIGVFVVGHGTSRSCSRTHVRLINPLSYQILVSPIKGEQNRILCYRQWGLSSEIRRLNYTFSHSTLPEAEVLGDAFWMFADESSDSQI